MQNVPNSRQSGFTLIELVVVVSVLAVIAAIAYPSLSSSGSPELDAAAAEFAAAMRFARSESIRTGKPHGFRQTITPRQIRVFRLDESTSPPGLVYDVYHPVDKQLYDIELDSQSLAAADALNRNVVFRGTCNKNANAYFDANGTPWCADPSNVLLESFEVQLDRAGDRRTVTLDGITGRVTIQ
jgi:type II secretion system protein H